MYNNIGGKIKGLAKASFIVVAIAEIITGIALMASNDDMIPVGLLVMVVGPIIAWVSSWLLYGFGELIDKASGIERNTRGGERKSEAQTKVDEEGISKNEKFCSQGLITEEYNLRLLKDKLELGMITEEEYQAKRAEIISKL